MGTKISGYRLKLKKAAPTLGHANNNTTDRPRIFEYNNFTALTWEKIQYKRNNSLYNIM